jgi:hypothetical protein
VQAAVEMTIMQSLVQTTAQKSDARGLAQSRVEDITDGDVTDGV